MGGWDKKESIKNDASYLEPIVNQLKKVQITTLRSTVTLTGVSNTVNIGIETYNRDSDILWVFSNTTYLALTEDYNINPDGLYIQKADGGTWENGTVFNFLVMKHINTDTNVVVTDGSQLGDDSVPNRKLDPDAKVGSLAQLSTGDKSDVVGALNEVNEQTVQNKQEIELVLGTGVLGEMYPRLNGETDDSLRINRAITDAENSNIGKIRFTSKSLDIYSTVTLPDGFTLEGFNFDSRGGSTAIGTKIYRKANVVAFKVEGQSVLTGTTKRSVRLNGIYFHGGDYATDFMQLIACGTLQIDDCMFIGMMGRQILLHEVMDSRFTNCVFEWGGTSDGLVPAIDLRSGSGYEFTNQIHFVGCRWESYRGTALATTGDNTNELFFTNCKFESLQSNVPHLKIHNANVVLFDGVNVCSRGTVGNTLSSQIEINNSAGIHGVLMLEHTGTIDTTASKIDRFVDIVQSSNIELFVYIYQNGNNIINDSCVVVDVLSNRYDISIRGSIRSANPLKNISNVPYRGMSTVIRNKNPFLQLARSDINGEYWDHGRITADNTKSKYQFIHGDNALGEIGIFEVNAATDFRMLRDFFMVNKAVHPAQLSVAPFGREGSFYTDVSVTPNCQRTYLGGNWRRVGYTTALSNITGSWNTGDIVYNPSTNASIVGWKRITSGSGHVLNTDWKEMKYE